LRMSIAQKINILLPLFLLAVSGLLAPSAEAAAKMEWIKTYDAINGTQLQYIGGMAVDQDGNMYISSGSAVYGPVSLEPGFWNISAEYLGDPFFEPESSDEITVTVNKLLSTIRLDASHSESVYGESVKFTAEVERASGSVSLIPTGTVTFQFAHAGGTATRTALLDNGIAELQVADLPVGTNFVTAAYDGDNFFEGSSSGTVQTEVSPASTTVSIGASPMQSEYGQTVTITATVSSNAPGGATPAGNVTFRLAADGQVLGTVPLDTNGQAAVTVNSLPVGTHEIEAEYSGSGSFLPGSGTVQLTVNKAAAALSVTSSQGTTVFGENVKFTATVVPAGSSVGTPSGTVTFAIGSEEIGKASLVAGEASLEADDLRVGEHTITAYYSGDNHFLPGNFSWLQQVVKATTTVNVGVSKTPVVYGENVRLTATVTVNAPGSGIPGGEVVFLANGGEIGRSALVGGTATLEAAQTVPIGVGNYQITAQYLGNESFEGSIAGLSAQLEVLRAETVTSVTPLGITSVYGEPVTLTAVVRPSEPGGGVPSGKVKFRHGSAELGEAPLAGGTASLIISGLEVGRYPISAEYGGDDSFLASAGTADLQVNKAETQVAVSASRTHVRVGESIAIHVSVTAVAPGSGTPTGKITVYEGTSSLGEAPLTPADGGTAEMVLSRGLSAGRHALYVSYEGDDRFLGSQSSPISFTVSRPSSPAPSASPAPSPMPEPTEPDPDEAPEDPIFTDIRGHWAEKDIIQAAKEGWGGGYPDRTFRPNRPVTRAEFTVMLVNALKLEGDGADLPFTDRDRIQAWARRAVSPAVRSGIVRGYDDGTFRPDAYITRAEMAVMVAAALGFRPEAATATGFRDDADIPAWAKGAVEALRSAGVVAGKGENRFDPHASATRAEAVKILIQALQHFNPAH